MRVPQSFWKIVAWVDDSALNAAGFMLHQRDEIELHGPITEEINFGDYEKVSIEEIERATACGFRNCSAVDGSISYLASMTDSRLMGHHKISMALDQFFFSEKQRERFSFMTLFECGFDLDFRFALNY